MLKFILDNCQIINNMIGLFEICIPVPNHILKGLNAFLFHVNHAKFHHPLYVFDLF